MIIVILFILAVVALPVAALYIETINANRVYMATEDGYRTVNDLAHLHRVSIINKKLVRFRA